MSNVELKIAITITLWDEKKKKLVWKGPFTAKTEYRRLKELQAMGLIQINFLNGMSKGQFLSNQKFINLDVAKIDWFMRTGECKRTYDEAVVGIADGTIRLGSDQHLDDVHDTKSGAMGTSKRP